MCSKAAAVTNIVVIVIIVFVAVGKCLTMVVQELFESCKEIATLLPMFFQNNEKKSYDEREMKKKN